jgi:hypothetical protein
LFHPGEGQMDNFCQRDANNTLNERETKLLDGENDVIGSFTFCILHEMGKIHGPYFI